MDIHGTSIISVPVTAKAVHRATLMKEDFIRLAFDADVDYKLKAGDWVEYDGMRYYLPEDYYPTMKDEATFAYELQFNAPWYNLYQTMFLFNTYDGDTIVKRESDWYITDTAKNILALIIRSTQDESRGCPCVFNEVLDCEPTVVKTFTFSSTSILTALNNLAKEFELEWWVTYEGGEFYLHFGECDNSVRRDNDGGVLFSNGARVKDSPSVVLTAGENVGKPSVSQKQGLKKKYYVFGSSRNIDQNAVQDMENGFVTSIVTKRLEMNGNPQVMPEGSGEEVVIFDDIYPRSDYMVTGVTPIEIVTEDVIGYDDGEPVFKRYNAYNLKIDGFSDFIFDLIENDPNVQNVEDIIAAGKPLSLKFITKEVGGETVTPKLAGFEFELSATLVTDENTGNSWYEFQIQHQEINGYIIPNDNLVPEIGDWVCIFNIKGAYIDGNDASNAQAELQEAFSKWYANKKKDISYTIKPYANENIDLNIGDAVVLNYKENSVTSRVFSFEKRLDERIDASYTISSYSKFGAVNQLKEDVKLLTASIANGTAGGGVDAGSVNNAIATYGRRLFLSKRTDDSAAGHIEFKEGLTSQKDSHLQRTTFGTFNSGFLGSGAVIDQYGRAEVQSLYSREFISTPEFRFNRITVTEGEQWNTNGFGIIEKVENHRVYLRLEDGDLPSVKAGDFCRGIYSNIGYAEENNTARYNLDNQPEFDDCGFPTKPNFFTAYFWVAEDPTRGSDGLWSFPYRTKGEWYETNDTPHPCKNMKFAQYGSNLDSLRQSSLYQTSIRHSYIQQLENVDSWEINPVNIASRYGYLGDLTITLKGSDGTTYNKQLEGNGLYVQDNVYFGNATIQLDPVTVKDLKDLLRNYNVYLTAYTDVIHVDDAGNVVDGLWVDSGEPPHISRQYRISTAVTVRNGAELLVEDEDMTHVDAAIGKYKIHAEPHHCSCIVDRSTIYITHIENVKDGVAGSPDDVNFDIDACRAMERVWIDLFIDCEGNGTITQTIPITIKHDPLPYIMADLTNENAAISFKSGGYIGLPVETTINMAKGNESLQIREIVINTINGVVPTWQGGIIDFETGTTTNTTSDGWGFSWNTATGLVQVLQAPFDVDDVTEIIITCSTMYAGVIYERNLSLHITRVVGLDIWEIVPTHQFIAVDKNDNFNFDNVGVNVYCTDSDGRHKVNALPNGFALKYKTVRVVLVQGNYETLVSVETNLSLSDTVRISDSTWRNTISSVIFTLYNASNVAEDVEEVQITRDGLGGQGSTGPAGNGILAITTYYLRTLANVTPNTNPLPAGCDGSWVTQLLPPTAAWPWLWRYTKIEYTNAPDYDSPCELISIYPSSPNINLLDDTAFYSEYAMEAWNYKGHVANDSHADPHSEYYNTGGENYNNFFGVVSGTQGHNAYCGRFRGQGTGDGQSRYVILLQQVVKSDSVDKITAGEWYTLSFMAKGAGQYSVSLRGSLNSQESEWVDTNSGVIVDGTTISQRTANFNGGSSDWVMHTITFKALTTISAERCYIQWAMPNSTTENEIFICMPKLEIGMSATAYMVGATSTMAFPRQGEWEEGVNYYAGNVGEPFIDARFHNDGWYRCIRSHVSSTENSPSSEAGKLYWKQGSYSGFIATGLLLAQAAYIENLGAKMLRTGSGNVPHVEMEGAMIKFFGRLGFPSIEIVTDEDDVAVLRFYDKSGNAMYDLGPKGIMQNFSQVPTSYSSCYYEPINGSNGVTQLIKIVGTQLTEQTVTGLGESAERLYYLLTEGYKAITNGNNIVCTYNISNTSYPSLWNKAVVKRNDYNDENDLRGVNPSTSDKIIPDGWYCGVVKNYVRDDYSFVFIHHFVGGKMITTKRVYFHDSEVLNNGDASWYDDAGNRHQHQGLSVIMTD